MYKGQILKMSAGMYRKARQDERGYVGSFYVRQLCVKRRGRRGGKGGRDRIERSEPHLWQECPIKAGVLGTNNFLTKILRMSRIG